MRSLEPHIKGFDPAEADRRTQRSSEELPVCPFNPFWDHRVVRRMHQLTEERTSKGIAEDTKDTTARKEMSLDSSVSLRMVKWEGRLLSPGAHMEVDGMAFGKTNFPH